jgi:ribosomal-protein-serine acetyltransferase
LNDLLYFSAHRIEPSEAAKNSLLAKKNEKNQKQKLKNKLMILQDEKISASLSLHLLEENMASEIFNLIDSNRAHLGEWLPWVEKTLSAADSLAFIRDTSARFAKGEAATFLMRQAGEAVGTAGFHDLNSDKAHTQIGYWLAESAQGQGLMRAAVQLLVAHFFAHYERDCIEIHCNSLNRRSQNVALRLGFSHQKTMMAETRGSTELFMFEVFMLTRTEWER